DYKIELKLEISLRFFLIYKLTKEEGRALKEFINKMLDKGFIRKLTSLAAVLLLLATKPGGGIRIYYNY
ncbi:uncharacterized protein K441DRAFT_548219, partial [Cenococcum geophilum 1.58]|uniref:uncharacterized protein n=1 Tax=Cenococcum geophilum 1.58 TaxID=794803 RepID=UPI00358EAC71